MTKKEMQGYLKRNDILIEGNTATWNCHITGKIQGTYIGTFRFKCFLTPTETLAASRDYRELLGPNAILAFKNEDDLAFALAQLRYRIVSAPPFWTSAVGVNSYQGDIADAEVIHMVLEAAIAAQLKYNAQLEKAKEDALKRAKAAAERLLAQKEGQVELEEEESEGSA